MFDITYALKSIHCMHLQEELKYIAKLDAWLKIEVINVFAFSVPHILFYAECTVKQYIFACIKFCEYLIFTLSQGFSFGGILNSICV